MFKNYTKFYFERLLQDGVGGVNSVNDDITDPTKRNPKARGTDGTQADSTQESSQTTGAVRGENQADAANINPVNITAKVGNLTGTALSANNLYLNSQMDDGQLNTDKNTYGTTRIGEKDFMFFFSEGNGPGDERYGMVELDENGKPKFAEGQSLADGSAWQKATPQIKELAEKLHKSRLGTMDKVGGLDNLNKIQDMAGTLKTLRAGDLSPQELAAVERLQGRLQEDGVKDNLSTIEQDFQKLLEADGGKLAKLDLEAKIKKLDSQDTGIETQVLKDKLKNAKSYDDVKQVQESLDRAVQEKAEENLKLSQEQKAQLAKDLKELEAKAKDDKALQAKLAKVKEHIQKKGADVNKADTGEIKALADAIKGKEEAKNPLRRPGDAQRQTNGGTTQKTGSIQNAIDAGGGFKPKSMQDLQEKLAAYKAAGKDSVKFQFSTSWCPHCHTPAAQNQAAHNAGEAVVYIDGDNSAFQGLKQQFGVTGYPSFRSQSLS